MSLRSSIVAWSQRSIGFYERMGYEKAGRRTEDDLGRPHPLAIMQLRSGHKIFGRAARIVLRPAREVDVPAITEVLRRAWLDAYAQIVPFEVIWRRRPSDRDEDA